MFRTTRHWFFCSLITLAFAGAAQAELIRVLVDGQVGFNSIPFGPLSSLSAPTGSPVRYTIPIDTDQFWFTSEEEGEEGTIYKLQNESVTFEAGASGLLHGRPQISPPPSFSNSALSFSGGAFSHGLSTSIINLDMPAGTPATTINFMLHGTSDPNPFNSTRFIEQNLGTYSPLTNPPFSTRDLILFPVGGGLMSVQMTSLTISQVPEPSSLLMLATGAVMLMRRRRTR